MSHYDCKSCHASPGEEHAMDCERNGKAVPADWVLLEAAKRGGWEKQTPEYGRLIWEAPAAYIGGHAFRALCDMIAKYETKPVDRKLLCAREAIEEAVRARVGYSQADACVRAIELWEQGYGA